MHFIPIQDHLVEKRNCLLSGKEFIISNKDIQFFDKISPLFGGKKYIIPAPKLCPGERQRRRLMFRNERKLYKRKCDKSGQEIISIYSPDKDYQVFDQKIWWGDDWSPFEYGKSFDFSRPFHKQFSELMHTVPRINLINKMHENSEYCNFSTNNKNSYLLFTSGWCEDSYFSNRVLNSKNTCDCSNITECELCYEAIDVDHCYNCRYIQSCVNCSDCSYGYELRNCKNCIGCYGLSNKQYCIGNKQYSKDSYEKESPKALQGLSRDLFQKHLSKCTRKYANIIGCENCTGDALSNSQNALECFESKSLQDCKYVYNATELQNCMDINNDDHSLWDYEVVGGESNSMECFCDISWFNRNAYYSSLCFHSQDIFGCAGVKSGSHCIFNTSYSTDEYETLCGKITDHMISTGEWGEFFPHEISPFGYNETVAQEYFPMTESEGAEKGWNWHTGENRNTYIGTHYVPLHITEYDEKKVGYETAQKNIEGILSGIIECQASGKPFKITKQELIFYIENGIEIPNKHPDVRHIERLSLRNPRTLYEKLCDSCQGKIITPYTPERPERVVCEECYRKLVY